MEKIYLDMCKQLHPEQWVKVYGIACDRWEYINVCQVSQLETALSDSVRIWFEYVGLQPIDEDGQAISVEEAFSDRLREHSRQWTMTNSR